MKKKILIILLIFISILVGCSSSENGGGDGSSIDPYYKETNKISTLLKNCNVDSDTILNYIRETENYPIKAYDIKKADLEQHSLCMDNLDQLTCEEVSEITSIEKLKEVEGCFQYPLKTKKQACVYNVNDYCKEIFDSCGEEYLIDICEDSFETWGSDESPEHGLNDDMVDNYCDSTIDKDQQITDQYDLFTYKCEDYTINCNNIDMLDFRNSEWKNSCIEE